MSSDGVSLMAFLLEKLLSRGVYVKSLYDEDVMASYSLVVYECLSGFSLRNPYM